MLISITILPHFDSECQEETNEFLTSPVRTLSSKARQGGLPSCRVCHRRSRHESWLCFFPYLAQYGIIKRDENVIGF